MERVRKDKIQQSVKKNRKVKRNYSNSKEKVEGFSKNKNVLDKRTKDSVKGGKKKKGRRKAIKKGTSAGNRSGGGSGGGPKAAKVWNKHKWKDVRMGIKSKKSKLELSTLEVIPDEDPGDEEDETVDEERVIKTKAKVSIGKKNTGENTPKGLKRLGKKPVPVEQVKESLRDRMLKRLDAARFRQINEELDNTVESSNPADAFQSDPALFKKYHEAYKGRMEQWPKKPLDMIIKWIIKNITKEKVIADLGCGEARLSLSVPNPVHSFDLFALNERVTACNMTKVPLEDGTVDVVVFCLSLMGTDVSKFIAEANRILKISGRLKIAEVASRFAGHTFVAFLKRMSKFGFVAKQRGQKSHVAEEEDDVFLMFEFMKKRHYKSSLGKMPSLMLAPSVYKKR